MTFTDVRSVRACVHVSFLYNTIFPSVILVFFDQFFLFFQTFYMLKYIRFFLCNIIELYIVYTAVAIFVYIYYIKKRRNFPFSYTFLLYDSFPLKSFFLKFLATLHLYIHQEIHCIAYLNLSYRIRNISLNSFQQRDKK